MRGGECREKPSKGILECGKTRFDRVLALCEMKSLLIVSDLYKKNRWD